MLIEIKRDIIEEALKKKGQKTNEPLDLLFQMAICAKKGFHIVWVPTLAEDSNLRKDLSALITQSSVNALCYAEERHRHDIGRLNRDVKIKTIITYGKNEKSSGIIVLNPSQAPKFQPYTELYFLVENLIDAEFYQIVLNLYRNTNGFASYECIMYPLMGGGAEIAKVMENEVRLCQHFCLAISDSDRRRPNGPKGQTAKNLQEAIISAPFNCDVYCLENVSEIENLIPRNVVRYLYPLKEGTIDILAKDPSFFDMKKGLNVMCLLDKKDYDYWKNLLPEKHEYFELWETLKKNNPNKQDFENALKKVNYDLLEGFGPNLMKRVMNTDVTASPIDVVKNIKANNLLHKTKMDNLNTFQQREWIEVGKRIFEWACGMKAM